jgi:hypothetical protein
MVKTLVFALKMAVNKYFKNPVRLSSKTPNPVRFGVSVL